MKYKVGDRVKVKSLDWYNENKIEEGIIECGGFTFLPKMTEICGKIVTIERVYNTCYDIKKFPYALTDAMIEGLADAREVPVEHPCDWLKRGFNLPDGYEFQDENGDIINARKLKIVKMEPKYPATYEECCEMLNLTPYYNVAYDYYRGEELDALYQLLVCRDAYWKIAGDWKPSWDKCTGEKYCIAGFLNNIKANTYADRNYFAKTESEYYNRILAFPTEEMRDVFYENFKDLIEQCKELL